MHDAQNSVTLRHRFHDHPDAADVIDLVKGQPLIVHLAMDAVDVFGPARYVCVVDPIILKSLA